MLNRHLPEHRFLLKKIALTGFFRRIAKNYLSESDAAAFALSRDYFPKKRWVKVAMKLISMIRPTTASTAANMMSGSCSECFPSRPGKKPRPWNEVRLYTKASGGQSDKRPKT